ncbi:MAG: hypothetical protein AAF805_05645 [Planctomycetota bacterium]
MNACARRLLPRGLVTAGQRSFLLAGYLLAPGAVAAGEPLRFTTDFDAGVTLEVGPKAATLRGGAEGSREWDALNRHSRIATARVYFAGNPAAAQLVALAADPAEPANRTLRFRVDGANEVTPVTRKCRVQFDLYRLRGVRTLYHRQRMRLGEGFTTLRGYEAGFRWMTLAEYWNEGNWQPDDWPWPFRVSVNLIRDPGPNQPLRFSLHGQDKDKRRRDGWSTVWGQENDEVEVPTETWVTTEMYFRDGDDRTGRFVMAMTPDGGERRIVFNVTAWMHNPASDQPLSEATLWGCNPMKLYTSERTADHARARGQTLDIHWDDFRVEAGLARPPMLESF